VNVSTIRTAEQVLHAAMQRGTQTAAGLAYALESAQLLQSPETAAELARLRTAWQSARRRAAYSFEMRLVERRAHEDTATELVALRDRVTELEALKPASIQTCQKCGAGYTLGQPCSTCQFKAEMAAATGVRECGCPARFERHAWGCPTLPVEDPHDSPLHHDYRLGHDLPEMPHA
jgi:hypothetical protein